MVKKENWKGRSVWVLRSDKGRLITWTKAKPKDTRAQIERQLRQTVTSRQTKPTLRKQTFQRTIFGKSQAQKDKQLVQYITGKRQFPRKNTQVKVTADVYLRRSKQSRVWNLYKRDMVGYSNKGVVNGEGIDQAKNMIYRLVADDTNIQNIKYDGVMDIRNVRVTFISWQLE